MFRFRVLGLGFRIRVARLGLGNYSGGSCTPAAVRRKNHLILAAGGEPAATPSVTRR